MPPKIRELLAELEQNGFLNVGGRGSHRNYKHPKGEKLTISGKLGSDARRYQEKLVKDAIRKVTEK